MVRNDDLPTTIASATRYAFSNLSAVLFGGVVIALSFLIIGLPFFLGYITRCMREIANGNGVMPEWDEIGQMFVDGLRMSLVFLAYVAIYLLIALIPAVPVVLCYVTNNTLLLAISALVFGFAMALVAAAFGVVFFASWTVYANTDSVRKAINLRQVIRLVSYNPSGYVVAILATLVIAAIGLVAMALFVTIPWAVFVICAASTYVYAKFYQNTIKSAAVDWLK